MLHKSKEMNTLTLSEIRKATLKDCSKLIQEVSKVVDRNLSTSCSVESIIHYQDIKARIVNLKSKVSLFDSVKPGNTLIYKNEPIELCKFTYNQLKGSAYKKNGTYLGVLNGTIKLHDCNKTINCPNCSGTGICTDCNGKKMVTCTVCDGDLECISCNGTGIYTCRHCDGDGECPDCEDGWVTCDSCGGDGEYDCPDCNGTGNYIDTECNRCYGSGYYAPGKVCKACGGAGRYVVECRRCKGTGIVTCSDCDGDGGWTCESCGGSNECSHCNGAGGFKCKACNETGTCGKCKGTGEIKCPSCHGKGTCNNCKGKKEVACPKCEGTGYFQSYTQYTLSESCSVKDLCTIDIEEKEIYDIAGELCYDDVLYNFFAKKANVYDAQKLKDSLGGKPELFDKWFGLDKQDTFTQDMVNDDYLNTTVQLYKIPVTEIVLKCNGTLYKILILGNNRIIFYDDLPSWMSRMLGRFTKMFN